VIFQNTLTRTLANSAALAAVNLQAETPKSPATRCFFRCFSKLCFFEENSEVIFQNTLTRTLDLSEHAYAHPESCSSFYHGTTSPV